MKFQYIADTVAVLLEAVLYVDHDEEEEEEEKKGSPLFISPLLFCVSLGSCLINVALWCIFDASQYPNTEKSLLLFLLTIENQ